MPDFLTVLTMRLAAAALLPLYVERRVQEFVFEPYGIINRIQSSQSYPRRDYIRSHRCVSLFLLA
jgi:hypothetical protein